MTKQEFFQRRKDMALLTQQGHTLSKIAAKYGISRQAVSQSLQKASKDGHKVILRKCGSKLNKSYEYHSTIKEVGHLKCCVVCGKTFTTKWKVTQTCGSDCRKTLLHKKIIQAKGSLGKWSRIESVTLSCNYCGKSFKRSKYRDSISKLGCGAKNTYCGRACYHKKVRTLNSWPSLDKYQKNLDLRLKK